MKTSAVWTASILLLVGCSGAPPDEGGSEPMETAQPPIEKHIASHFAAMEEIGESGDTAVENSLKSLRRRPEAISKLAEMYAAQSVSTADSMESAARGRARYAIVHTLGELRDQAALPLLKEVAETALPDPVASSEDYKSEYLVHLRAIDGLGKLGAVDVLRRLYETHGVLSAPAAVALYELGQAPPGIVEVDPKTVIGVPNPFDHTPKAKKPRAVSTYPIAQPVE